MITFYQLWNIQSYDNEAPKIILDRNILNIIEGPNEVGKSVIFKVLRQMCIPDSYPATDLIRRGCEYGALLLGTQNDYQVLYQIYKSKCLFILLHGAEKQSWYQKEMPDEIRKVLGLTFDSDSEVILNVLQNPLDSPSPFVTTSRRFGGAMIKMVSTHPMLETSMDNLTQWEAEANSAKMTQSTYVKSLNTTNKYYVYTDTAVLKYKLDRVAKFKEICEPCIELDEISHELRDACNCEPAEFTTDMCSARAIIEVYGLSDSIDKILQELSQALDSAPQEIDSNVLEVASFCCTVLDAGGCLVEVLGALNGTMDSAPMVVNSPNVKVLELLQCLDILISAKYDVFGLISAADSYPAEVKFDLIDAKLVTSITDRCFEVVNVVKSLWENIKNYEECCVKSQAARVNLIELKRILKICPTCGKRFDEDVQSEDVQDDDSKYCNHTRAALVGQSI